MGRAGDEHRLLLNLWVRVAPVRRKSIRPCSGSGWSQRDHVAAAREFQI